jgi:hypothetical protein
MTETSRIVIYLRAAQERLGDAVEVILTSPHLEGSAGARLLRIIRELQRMEDEIAGQEGSDIHHQQRAV